MKLFYLLGFPLALASCALVLSVSLGLDGPQHPDHAKRTHVRVTQHRVRQLYPFALTFTSQVNAYAYAHGKEPIQQVTCVAGSVGHYACAFVFHRTCRLATLDARDVGPIQVLSSYRVKLTAAKCTVRAAFKSLSQE